MKYAWFASNLSPNESDFVIFVTFAVGILLIAFGFLTLLLARQPDQYPEVLYSYLLVSVTLWAGRLALELLYPINLRMFGIEPFTALVAPGVAAQVVVLAFAAAKAHRILRPIANGD